MRRIAVAAMVISLISVVHSGCNRSRTCDDGYHDGKGLSVIWDRHDCWRRHAHMISPQEFFDARDFRPDSVYGAPYGWHDEDYSRFRNDECRYRERAHYGERYHGHGLRRSHQDSVSERYMPPLAPDMEYDE